MEITVIIDKTRYQYGFSADDDRFLEEWLYAWPQGRRRQQWLLRTGDRFKFGDYLQGENHLIQELTRPNSLFLSAAAQNRHRQLSPLYRWFASIRTLLPNPPFTAWPIRSSSTLSFNEFIDSINLLTHAKRHSQQSSPFPPEQPGQDIDQAFLDLLRATDVGILNFRLVKPGGTARTGVLVQHQSDSPDAWLPLEEESQGTQTLFRIGPLILEALAQGSLLIVDELEASLHPLLGQRIVEHFNQPALNPRHAQILFTTHDTNLLGSLTETPPLRRDQVWLTEKDRDGATVLYPLTDYRPQKGENLERGYLQGRFGAIPRIQDWMPREEWAAE